MLFEARFVYWFYASEQRAASSERWATQMYLWLDVSMYLSDAANEWAFGRHLRLVIFWSHTVSMCVCVCVGSHKLCHTDSHVPQMYLVWNVSCSLFLVSCICPLLAELSSRPHLTRSYLVFMHVVRSLFVCSIDNAACSVQRAACNMVHATCSGSTSSTSSLKSQMSNDCRARHSRVLHS